MQEQRCRVLVVEDDRASRRALLMLLKMKGFEVSHACTLSEALDQLKKTEPSHILLDLMLPDGNGAAILNHVRSRNLPTRVAVTSGASNWESLMSESTPRPDAIFSKPVQLDPLIAWLKSADDHVKKSAIDAS